MSSVRWGAGGFAIVPEWLLDARVTSKGVERPIRDRAIRLYALLGRYADKNGHSFPSRKTLAGRLGCSASMLDLAVQELVVVKALTVAKRQRRDGSQASNEYVLHATPTDMSVDPPTAPSGGMNENHDEREPEEPSPATPSKVVKDYVWDALEAIFGPPTTPQHRSRFGRVQKELLADTSLAQSAVATEIPLRAARYRSKWPDADLTLEAFAKHWPDLRSNGSRPSANFPTHLLDAEEFREWRRTATRDDMVRYQHEFDVDDHGAPLEGF